MSPTSNFGYQASIWNANENSRHQKRKGWWNASYPVNTQGCDYFLHHSGMEDVSRMGLNAPSTLQRYNNLPNHQTKKRKKLTYRRYKHGKLYKKPPKCIIRKAKIMYLPMRTWLPNTSSPKPNYSVDSFPFLYASMTSRSLCSSPACIFWRSSTWAESINNCPIDMSWLSSPINNGYFTEDTIWKDTLSYRAQSTSVYCWKARRIASALLSPSIWKE